MDTLQGINISHLGKRKIIFKMPFLGDMLVPWRVMQSLVLTNWPMQIWRPQTMKACGNQKLCRHLLRLFQFLPLGLISLRTLPAIVWTPSDCEGDGTRPQTCGKNQSWHSVARANWTSSGRCCRPHDAHAPAKSGKLWNTESGTLPFFSFSNLNVSSVLNLFDIWHCPAVLQISWSPFVVKDLCRRYWPSQWYPSHLHPNTDPQSDWQYATPKLCRSTMLMSSLRSQTEYPFCGSIQCAGQTPVREDLKEGNCMTKENLSTASTSEWSF